MSRKEKSPQHEIPSNPIMTMRISNKEKAEFQYAAKADGYRSLGTWLKVIARRRAIEIELKEKRV
jgi:hypothetical protein